MATASEEIEASEQPDVVVKLRGCVERPGTVFEELCQERGLDTTAAIARHVGLSERQIGRILAQEDDPSSKFIGKVLVRWPRCSFRALFAVVDEETGQERR